MKNISHKYLINKILELERIKSVGHFGYYTRKFTNYTGSLDSEYIPNISTI
jgi:hypothetical protein